MSEPSAAISAKRFVLTLNCADSKGIVAGVSQTLLEQGCNILDSAQAADGQSGQFFMRVSFVADGRQDVEALRSAIGPVTKKFSMDWAIYDLAIRPRVVLMVSRFGHCLNDLLYRYRISALPIDIPAIISNHRDFYQLAAAHNIPYHHLPLTPSTKEQQEERIRQILREERCDLLVLARYMQVLSPTLCGELHKKAINIHHSFLPSFQGAKPYQQAHDRGVKLIGATAHYVTKELDEGPIIEQDVARVHHGMSAEDFAAAGRDVESAVLARALKWHIEHRILLNGNRTVVFP